MTAFEFLEKLYESWKQSRLRSWQLWRFSDSMLGRFDRAAGCDGQTGTFAIRQGICIACGYLLLTPCKNIANCNWGQSLVADPPLYRTQCVFDRLLLAISDHHRGPLIAKYRPRTNNYTAQKHLTVVQFLAPNTHVDRYSMLVSTGRASSSVLQESNGQRKQCICRFSLFIRKKNKLHLYTSICCGSLVQHAVYIHKSCTAGPQKRRRQQTYNILA